MPKSVSQKDVQKLYEDWANSIPGYHIDDPKFSSKIIHQVNSTIFNHTNPEPEN